MEAVNDKHNQESPIFVDIVYNFGKTMLSESELLALPGHNTSIEYLPFLNEHLQVHAVRVINETYSKKIDNVFFHFFKGRISKLWLPFQLHAFLKKLNPAIILVHGFRNPVQLLLLCLQTKSTIVLHYNGGGIPGGLSGQLQKLARFFVYHYTFTAYEQAIPFVEANFIKKTANIYEIPEASTHKKHYAKAEARRRLNLSMDDKIFLWSGNLNLNKDPITVLNGLLDYLLDNASTRLFMIFRTDELWLEVKQLITDNPQIKPQIQLIGFVEHEKLDDYYCSADYFVLGSHYEGSGYSLIESMACGCIPLVTDIPSFRKLTNNGKLGVLWQTGNVSSLKAALQKVLQKNIAEESQKVINHFQEEISIEAIARKQLQMAHHILSKK